HICPKGLFENEMKNLFFILFSKDRECKFISRALLRDLEINKVRKLRLAIFSFIKAKIFSNLTVGQNF
ncbi:MAG: hypothetical protein AAF599_04210, partial [Bacteroidota bacterium]